MRKGSNVAANTNCIALILRHDARTILYSCDSQVRRYYFPLVKIWPTRIGNRK